jgi:hypothetical protein
MDTIATLLPYVLAAVAVLLFAWFRAWEVLNREIDLLLALLLSVLAAVVAGSVDLGTDAPAYRVYYDTMLSSSRTPYLWWEPGFEFLARLFALAGAPYGVFVFACVLASHLIKLYVFKELSPNLLLGFFVLMCLNVGEVSFIRQYLAASLVLLSFYLLTKQRPISAISVIFLAVLFHKTALIAGGLVFVTCYRVRSLKWIGIAAVVATVIVLVVPSDLAYNIRGRLEAQVFRYVMEEYVQGMDAPGLALFRNVSKYFVYVLFAAWMLSVPARSWVETQQRNSGRVVLALSIASVGLIVLLSPIFARMSGYVFPFLALCIRSERFRPGYEQLPWQYAAGVLLLMHLAVSLFPLVEYY